MPCYSAGQFAVRFGLEFHDQIFQPRGLLNVQRLDFDRLQIAKRLKDFIWVENKSFAACHSRSEIIAD